MDLAMFLELAFYFKVLEPRNIVLLRHVLAMLDGQPQAVTIRTTMTAMRQISEG